MNIPKNAAAMISDSISSSKEPKEPSDGPLVEGEEGLSLEDAAASELMDAFGSKDPKRLVSAFRAMFDAVQASEPESPIFSDAEMSFDE